MKKAWITILAILCVWCLVSCRLAQEVEGEVAAAPSESPASESTVIVEDAQATDTMVEETDPSSEGEPEAITPEAVDECVKCHTDKQMLIDTAKPLEVAESENEGEG